MGLALRLALAMVTSIAFLIAFGPAAAQADHGEFDIDEFEAGTCAQNTEPSFPVGTGPGQCTYESEPQDEWFYTQAGGHPDYGIIDFSFHRKDDGSPEGQVKNLRTDLPIGLSVNPQAVPKCTEEQLETVGCPPETKIGDNYITAYAPGVIPGTEHVTLPAVAVYNMVPREGQPLMAGMRVLVPALGLDHPIYLVGDVEWEGDYHQFFTISDISDDVQVVRNRLVFDGQANADGEGPDFIRLPSTCVGPQRTYLHAAPHADPDDFVTEFADTPVGATGCDEQPFNPQIDVDPASNRTDSPSEVTVQVNVPQPDGDIQPSDVREVQVALPRGMVLNPAAARNLGTCTDSQFGMGTRNEIKCPASSAIGAASIETPVLPPDTLNGKVYAGRPLSNNPASGRQFRIFLDASNERYGVSVRLAGEVTVHPTTGRLFANFDEIPDLNGLPQAPFSSFTARFRGGAQSILSTPSTCGPHRTAARFVPWSTADLEGGPISDFEPSGGEGAVISTSSYTLTRRPGGGTCAEDLGDRGFSPDLSAGMQDSSAGTFSPLFVDMSRDDGEQEFKGVDMTLPAGLTAKLAGIPYCPDSAINIADDRNARSELASASCPAASRIGKADLAVGTGPQPYGLTGQAYLAGPYAGARLSMVVVTPALAGPYDLGTVAVRVALHVDPETLEIRAVSDRIPHLQRGVQVALRDIEMDFDRKDFNINPTGCWDKFFHGTIWGGGSSPGNHTGWSGAGVSDRFAATGCAELGFRPQIYTRMFGPRRIMQRSGHPSFRSVVRPQPGQANIRNAVVLMPPSVQLDQGNIRTVCTRDQFAADECPRRSIYGVAVARSPLVDGRLRGPVYLRSSDNQLPDLVARLRHPQVEVVLAGRIDSFRRRIRTAFAFVPDAPVGHFALRLFGGGKRGILVNSRDLCDRRWAVPHWFRGHNLKTKGGRSGLTNLACRARRGRR